MAVDKAAAARHVVMSDAAKQEVAIEVARQHIAAPETATPSEQSPEAMVDRLFTHTDLAKHAVDGGEVRKSSPPTGPSRCWPTSSAMADTGIGRGVGAPAGRRGADSSGSRETNSRARSIRDSGRPNLGEERILRQGNRQPVARCGRHPYQLHPGS